MEPEPDPLEKLPTPHWQMRTTEQLRRLFTQTTPWNNTVLVLSFLLGFMSCVGLFIVFLPTVDVLRVIGIIVVVFLSGVGVVRLCWLLLARFFACKKCGTLMRPHGGLSLWRCCRVNCGYEEWRAGGFVKDSRSSGE